MLCVLILIVGVIWLLIARPWSSNASAAEETGAQGGAAQPLLPVVSRSPEPTDSPSIPGPTEGATPTATPAQTPAATTRATPTPGASVSACSANDVTVTAVTDKRSYAAGQDPKLSIQLTNTSSSSCALNVGTTVQVFTITSGSDTWWRSTDCQSEPSDMVVVLAAGEKVSSAEPIVWDRSRSSVATCQAKDRPKAPGGGATYRLAVSIGGIDSDDDATFQLN